MFKGVLKKLALGAAVVFSSVCAFAEGATGSTDVSQITSNVETVGTSIKEGLSAAVSAALPFIVACLVASIGIYIIPLVWRWIKKSFNGR